ncbi:Uu.00g136160.m01.CDS01 [Anthostomella pinea]|uniref:Uu.00g136160.m01.CDS01 n=1 Tax=Anthostomella pinea TaxID=933095 RepID=A0AAI8VP87_9PEZI|nr:Uu.00g136160.m01.CDS01 [Anthostomella pinea]
MATEPSRAAGDQWKPRSGRNNNFNDQQDDELSATVDTPGPLNVSDYPPAVSQSSTHGKRRRASMRSSGKQTGWVPRLEDVEEGTWTI